MGTLVHYAKSTYQIMPETSTLFLAARFNDLRMKRPDYALRLVRFARIDELWCKSLVRPRMPFGAVSAAPSET